MPRFLMTIHDKTVKLLNCKREHYGEVMRKLLRYLINGWDDLIKYRKDGRYTIDDMLIEKAIRLFTIHRKSSSFFSNEDGVETVLTFFTLIETCKNVGFNLRDYIATTIRLLMDGNENYNNLVPMSLAI